MMRHPRITIAAIAIVAAGGVAGIAFAAGGSGGSGGLYGSSNSKSTNGSVAVPVSPARSWTVQTATATVQGKSEMILVDSKGLPLYTYKGDSATQTAVTGQLAGLWPPLVANAPTVRGAMGTLTTVQTVNGNQVAYNGHFLYTFVNDKPGQITGQNVQNFSIATPDLIASASSTATNMSSQSGNGYGW
jgi:predicted lipoprotein with Yx(FWY)xxD motif